MAGPPSVFACAMAAVGVAAFGTGQFFVQKVGTSIQARYLRELISAGKL